MLIITKNIIIILKFEKTHVQELFDVQATINVDAV